MWIKRNTDSPPADGPYTVFGTVNAGTPYEQKSRFVAYWNSSQHAFVDKDGEDLTGINESVVYWFDFSQVQNPKL